MYNIDYRNERGYPMSITTYIIVSFLVWLLFHSISKHLFKDKNKVYSSKLELFTYWGAHTLIWIIFLAFYSAINSGYQDIADHINLVIDDDIQFVSFIIMIMFLYSGIRYNVV